VTHAAPALEIVENRGPAASDMALAAADKSQQKAFVVGTKVALDAKNNDLASARVSVHVNGKLREEAFGSEVMGRGRCTRYSGLPTNSLSSGPRSKRALASWLVRLPGNIGPCPVTRLKPILCHLAP